jgi:hypothetical protein
MINLSVLTEDIGNRLIEELKQKGVCNLKAGNLVISANSDDNSLSIHIEKAPSLTEEFQDFLEQLDDDLFVDTCDLLGNDTINRIQTGLDSDDIESQRLSILKFKEALKVVASNKIKQLTQYV